ncbi:MAG: hypothetical protein JXA73_08455 [Acidobacteria bacterium]|nr:hypothetical protein [Acidobacteriota bacterium]
MQSPVFILPHPGKLLPGELADFVEEGRSGFTFAVGDAGALEQAMRKFIDDPELAERLSLSTE